MDRYILRYIMFTLRSKSNQMISILDADYCKCILENGCSIAFT